MYLECSDLIPALMPPFNHWSSLKLSLFFKENTKLYPRAAHKQEREGSSSK